MPPKAIFKGQTFAFSGKLSRPRKDYEDLVRKFGGDVKESVTAAVTFLVSTDDDVKVNSAKVATAQARDVPIVQEGFIGACVVAKRFLDFAHFVCKAPAKKRKATPKAEPSKRAKVREAKPPPNFTEATVSVIQKSGLADKAAVVQEQFSKGFMKGSLTWDVELLLNDPAKGKDKYYNMQLLVAREEGDVFWAVQHWGRTGRPGTSHVDGPFADICAAKRVFRRKYRAKTGNVWGQCGGSFEEAPGKYHLLAKEFRQETPGLWQYYLHNTVDGKEVGWYDYESNAAENMELYWRQLQSNPRLGIRVIQTDYFKYEIDFVGMFQTNTTSGTRRAIRRVPAGEHPSPKPPLKIPVTQKPVAAAPPGAESSDEEEKDELDSEDCEEEEEDEEADEEVEDAKKECGGGAGDEETNEDEEKKRNGKEEDEAMDEAPVHAMSRAAKASAEEETTDEAETLPFGDSLSAATLSMGGNAACR
mmetsp:Transcript_115531/g.326583  ORF Transcript_115531/g.326583 Transcript_115531/m.326583 type:complete len:474 (-) Transcript_115531:36-1457(-)